MPALYDMVSVTALLVVLLALRRVKRWDGFLFLVFVAWYGAGRVIEDFFRVDETHGTGLSASQWTALVASLASLYILVIHHRTPRLRRSAESNDPPARPEEPAPAGPSDGRRAPSGD